MIRNGKALLVQHHQLRRLRAFSKRKMYCNI
uniref:Uncharacterized protein n=1 Tax=Anguilla anguilla TaxID=7936 RepID=A0A0E9VIG6_ANGAN